jgi:hypothetical protein
VYQGRSGASDLNSKIGRSLRIPHYPEQKLKWHNGRVSRSRLERGGFGDCRFVRRAALPTAPSFTWFRSPRHRYLLLLSLIADRGADCKWQPPEAELLKVPSENTSLDDTAFPDLLKQAAGIAKDGDLMADHLYARPSDHPGEARAVLTVGRMLGIAAEDI